VPQLAIESMMGIAPEFNRSALKGSSVTSFEYHGIPQPVFFPRVRRSML
jgi:hypothetical protein